MSKIVQWLAAPLLFLVSSPSLFSAELSFDFSKEKLNEQPAGFLSTVTGQGKPGTWRIIEDEVPSAFPALTPDATPNKRRVLAQMSRDLTDEHYPLLIYTNEVFADFTFTTRFKTVAGVVEQMAGIVFRYQDEKNYYYLRGSSKGGTFRFFKVVAGERSAPIGPEIQIPSGVWHELSVNARGNELKMLLNGQQLIPTATDNSFRFGKVGFWTKSDSVSYFVDSRISYTPRESYAKTLLRQVRDRFPRVEAMRLYAANPTQQELRVVASTDESMLGKPATEIERDVLANGNKYFGRLKPGVVVTMPVHDRNGEVIAVLRIELDSFPGQTEGNALARALPIVKDLESRITEAKDLF